MSPRWILAIAAVVSVLGVTALADAVVTSDEERLEEVGAALASGDEGARLDALLPYVDLEREAVRVGSRSVRTDRELSRALVDELGALDVGDLEVVESRARVTGETGRIAMRFRTDDRLVDTELTLVRNGQGWLLTGARRL